MAREVVITDDLDGSSGAQTITYSFEGQEYEIDLAEKNLEKLREALKPYLDKSRRVERQALLPTSTRGTRRRSSSGGGSGRTDLAEIRTWAQANGYQVAERGRIKKDVIDAYDEAHK
jgi:Lsr2